MIGPGKYDDMLTHVRRATNAGGVLLIVWDGDHGSGFGVQASPWVTLQIPQILRECADAIEKDMQEGKL